MAQSARHSLLENIALSGQTGQNTGLKPVCLSIDDPVTQCMRPNLSASLNHPQARVTWKLQEAQLGAHRTVQIDILRAPRYVDVVFIYALPCGAFVDPNEVGLSLVSVPGQSVDLEARSDLAQPQLVVVRGSSAPSSLMLPIHFRYPPLSSSDEQVARVVLPHVPSVWIKETADSNWAEITTVTKSSFPFADVPCGREQDVKWVRIVAALTGIVGFVLLVGRKVLQIAFPGKETGKRD